jgi:hypothetical protein
MSSAGWTRWQRISSRMTKAGKSVTPESFVTNASSKESSVDAQESPVKEPEAKRPIRRRVTEHLVVGAKISLFPATRV